MSKQVKTGMGEITVHTPHDRDLNLQSRGVKDILIACTDNLSISPVFRMPSGASFTPPTW